MASAAISRWGAGLPAAIASALMAGCGWLEPPSIPSEGPDAPGEPELVLSGTAERPPAADELAEIEPNHDFASAQPASFNETIRISGSIAAGGTPLDRDVFDLGPASPGDRILAGLTVTSGGDVVLGLLDEEQRILGYVDHSSLSAGPREMDFVIRTATERLYVVVGTRSLSSITRGYRVGISVQRGAGLSVVRPQVLVLNFSGAPAVRIGAREPVDVPPFDAAAINPFLAGQTETLISAVLAKVNADFEGLEVVVYRDSDPDLPAGGHSTVYFGTYDSRLLGLADNVDPYNNQSEQSAILFTDTFGVFNILAPTLDQMAQALANTTSHEAGHLLGLRHTAHPSDLMDTTATARQMMLDQDFGVAELNASVLPIGLQDSPLMLSWSVGGALLKSPGAKTAARQRAAEVSGGAGDFYVPRAWLMGCSCDECDPRSHGHGH